VLTVPILLLAMRSYLPGLGLLLERTLPSGTSHWLELALATPVVIWAGWPFFQRGWRSVAIWSLNMFTLIAIGVGAAYAYSVVATLAPGMFPDAFWDASGEVDLYFEVAAVIVVLVLLGQVLELRAREQTGGALRAVLDLAPQTARRLTRDGDEEEIALDCVHAGDRLRVRPGDKVPVALGRRQRAAPAGCEAVMVGLREWHRLSGGAPECDERHDVMGRAHDVGRGPLWPAGHRAPRPGDRCADQVPPQLTTGVQGSCQTNRRGFERGDRKHLPAMRAAGGASIGLTFTPA
jgi:hypothetical protein